MRETGTANSPLVSIIVPVYNCAEYVQQCLDSVYAQIYENWEIICVDDGSQDDSLSILRVNESLHDRVRVISTANKGPGSARNEGIVRAEGKFVLFLDADDFIDPRLLEITVSQAEKTNADIVVWDVWFFNDRHGRVQHPPMGILHFTPFIQDGSVFSWRTSPDDILLSFQNWPWNKLFRTSFVNQNGLRFQEDVMRTEDVLFVCVALMRAQRITTVEGRLSCYRVMRPGSAMATKDEYPFDFLTAILAFKEFLKQEGLYEEVGRSYRNWALSSALYNLHTLNSFESFSEVFDCLKVSGFRDLGVADCEKDEFFDEYLYDSMMAVCSLSVSEYLFLRTRMLDRACEESDAAGDFARIEAAEAQDRFEEELSDQRIRLEKENARISEALRVSQRELEDVLNAAEQRIGAVVCRIPRAVQRKMLSRKKK